LSEHLFFFRSYWGGAYVKGSIQHQRSIIDRRPLFKRCSRVMSRSPNDDVVRAHMKLRADMLYPLA